MPAGFVVTVDAGDRIHFLDWGGPATNQHGSGAVLIHGLSQTAWIWAPVARRLAAANPTTPTIPTITMDLRGHGLSDAPTEDGAYALGVLADDAIATAEASGVAADGRRAVLVGHGFGAIVAAVAATRLGERCSGLVLVDGGWEAIEASTGMDVEEFIRGLDEPPEVMRSLRAFLADRRAFDPSTWDDDQETAARATVVETHAGRVVPATRPHALEACVRAMFAYEPATTLTAVEAPIVAMVAATATDGDAGSRAGTLAAVSAARVAAGRGPIGVRSFQAAGHNLMRYRPADVTDAILSLARPDS